MAALIKEPDETAIQVAKAWTNLWLFGETGETTSLSAVPFGVHGEMEIKKQPELEAVFEKLSVEAVKLDPKMLEAKIVSSTPEKVVVMVNLRQALQPGKFTPAESLAMVERICSALKYADEEGILHRDINRRIFLSTRKAGSKSRTSASRKWLV